LWYSHANLHWVVGKFVLQIADLIVVCVLLFCYMVAVAGIDYAWLEFFFLILLWDHWHRLWFMWIGHIILNFASSAEWISQT
jgi:hypothetical protein